LFSQDATLDTRLPGITLSNHSGVLLTMNRNAASAQKEADKKLVEIDAKRERLKRKEEATRYLEEKLKSL
jgi:uncharacterized protein (DUF3084 family)